MIQDGREGLVDNSGWKEGKKGKGSAEYPEIKRKVLGWS